MAFECAAEDHLGDHGRIDGELLWLMNGSVAIAMSTSGSSDPPSCPDR
jgi:hypothetical protein